MNILFHLFYLIAKFLLTLKLSFLGIKLVFASKFFCYWLWKLSVLCHRSAPLMITRWKQEPESETVCSAVVCRRDLRVSWSTQNESKLHQVHVGGWIQTSTCWCKLRGVAECVSWLRLCRAPPEGRVRAVRALCASPQPRLSGSG